jgi:NADH-quinone oxidoreductase subunit A
VEQKRGLSQLWHLTGQIKHLQENAACHASELRESCQKWRRAMLGNEAILLQLLFAALVTAFFITAACLVGPRNPSPQKTTLYECGIEPTGSAKQRFPVKFYLIAMLFVLFDIEAAFLYPWAIMVRELGVIGLVEVAIFIFVLMLGLVYAWRKGALDWE